MKEVLLEEIWGEESTYETAVRVIRETIEATDGAVIFGTSTVAKIMLETLQDLGIEPLCFGVDSLFKYEDELYGIPVITVQEMIKQYGNKTMLVGGMVPYERMKKRMLQAGYESFIDKELIFYVHRMTELARHKGVEVGQYEKSVKVKKFKDRLSFDRVGLKVTNRCTLNCKNCNAYIPYVRQYGDFDTSLMIQSIEKAVQSIDYIAAMPVFGGEPFLHPGLKTILEYICDSPSILESYVITNGTMVPSDELLAFMAQRRVSIRISDYGENLSRKKKELVEKCKEYQIACSILPPPQWFDYGMIEPAKNQNMDKVAQCKNSNQPEISNGQWHVCGRSSVGTMIGALRNNEEEYINLLDDSLTPEENREKMKRLKDLNIPRIACGYCEGNTTTVEPAIQL